MVDPTMYVIEIMVNPGIYASLNRPGRASQAWHNFCMGVRADAGNIQVNGKNVIHLVKSLDGYEEGYRGSTSFYIPAMIDTPEEDVKFTCKIRIADHAEHRKPKEVIWSFIYPSGKRNYANDRAVVRKELQENVNALWGIYGSL